jgi:tRNA(Arg) A34 adenosine deaminase TadA
LENANSYLFYQAELALASDETPVGCVFVHDGKVIAQGMNGTNVTMNVSKQIENHHALHLIMLFALHQQHLLRNNYSSSNASII